MSHALDLHGVFFFKIKDNKKHGTFDSVGIKGEI